ncbi:TPA: arsenate reductase ArsC [Candidatus Poribacteria bacterium]|nr:arsenate reductase ArsC [Candidatus Poribacteria bacterium]
MAKAKVLFLCTRNSVRSQIAEAFLKKYAGDKFEVYSAGLEPGEIHPYTKKVMEEIGFDFSKNRSKGLSEFMGKMHIGFLITVCSNAEEKCPFFPGIAKRLHWPFEDPASYEGTEEEKLAKFREVRDKIDEKIKSWLEEMKDEF